jgi:hypothetical protein
LCLQTPALLTGDLNIKLGEPGPDGLEESDFT